jgi:hypothetical protein
MALLHAEISNHILKEAFFTNKYMLVEIISFIIWEFQTNFDLKIVKPRRKLRSSELLHSE